MTTNLELHHLVYEGAFEHNLEGWVSHEEHDDLVALCSRDHERVHVLLDTDPGYSYYLSRRVASLRIIHAMRAKLIRFLLEPSIVLESAK